jgi:type II secretory pathway pseudopilin PulG
VSVVWAVQRATSAGFTVVDLLIALTLTVLISALAAPRTAHTVSVTQGRHAAALVAARIRLARLHAVTTRKATAVVFDLVGGHWQLRVCRDETGDGVRRADIAAGLDICVGDPVVVHRRVSRADIAWLPGVPDPDGLPGTGTPVRFGSSSMASCTPVGGCTPGTVFVLAGSEQFAVRVTGATGRTRVMRYDRGTGAWPIE